MNKRLGYFLLIVGLILIILSASFIYQLSLSNDEILIATSQSMEPIFSGGDVVRVDTNILVNEIIASPKDSNPPGDIIAFHEPRDAGDIIIHRAVERINNQDGTYSFKTWGDTNIAPDWWEVHQSNIVGKIGEVNPPFWSYNFLFWIAMFIVGILLLILGVIVIV